MLAATVVGRSGTAYELPSSFFSGRQMATPDDVKKLRGLLAAWAAEVAASIKSGGIYLFGSLVYRDGTQFVPGSDVDLAILFPEDAKDAVERVAWLDKLLRHKVELEKRLADLFGHSRSEPICSVVALTTAETGADIHKDGAEQFFGNNRFLDLLAGTQYDKFPGAGDQQI